MSIFNFITVTLYYYAIDGTRYDDLDLVISSVLSITYKIIRSGFFSQHALLRVNIYFMN